MSNRWDERYHSGEMSDKPPEPVLVEHALLLQPGLALDVACGIGRHTVWLTDRGWRVTAVDYSTVALDMLRRRVSTSVEIVEADLEAGEFEIAPDRYDLICDMCFLHRPLFEPMKQGVTRGGVFIGVFPRRGAFRLEPGELDPYFAGWEILHRFQGFPGGAGEKRSSLAAFRSSAATQTAVASAY
jgi:SAM-dependent methyltransferase